MSVDLVGSTAFKANKNHSDPKEGSPSPAWVDQFRTFYKDFPLEVRKAHDLVVKALDGELPSEATGRPLVWKTIGDEIIFCSRVRSIDHVAASVSAFLKALEQYSKRLEADKMPLRLKGAGWLAAFPAPNISIAVAAQDKPSENTEEFELAADDAPNNFDFLGTGIDTGFRVAKNASDDRFVASVELAFALARAGTKKRFPHTFGYHGREVLKGVIDGAPYPVISVDTERSEIKSKLKSREAALTGETTIQPHALCDFLETFMTVANIDVPCLDDGSSGAGAQGWPESYRRYQAAFADNLLIDEANVKQVAEQGGTEPTDDASLEPAKEFLDQLLTSPEASGAEGTTDSCGGPAPEPDAGKT